MRAQGKFGNYERKRNGLPQYRNNELSSPCAPLSLFNHHVCFRRMPEGFEVLIANYIGSYQKSEVLTI